MLGSFPFLKSQIYNNLAIPCSVLSFLEDIRALNKDTFVFLMIHCTDRYHVAHFMLFIHKSGSTLLTGCNVG